MISPTTQFEKWTITSNHIEGVDALFASDVPEPNTCCVPFRTEGYDSVIFECNEPADPKHYDLFEELHYKFVCLTRFVIPGELVAELMEMDVKHVYVVRDNQAVRIYLETVRAFMQRATSKLRWGSRDGSEH